MVAGHRRRARSHETAVDTRGRGIDNGFPRSVRYNWSIVGADRCFKLLNVHEDTRRVPPALLERGAMGILEVSTRGGQTYGHGIL